MVKIRLSRAGRRKLVMYHLVATDSRAPRDGRPLEQLGLYGPKQNQIVVDLDRVAYWLKVGGQLTVGAKQVLDKFVRARRASRDQQRSPHSERRGSAPAILVSRLPGPPSSAGEESTENAATPDIRQPRQPHR